MALGRYLVFGCLDPLGYRYLDQATTWEVYKTCVDGTCRPAKQHEPSTPGIGNAVGP